MHTFKFYEMGLPHPHQTYSLTVRRMTSLEWLSEVDELMNKNIESKPESTWLKKTKAFKTEDSI